MPLVIFIFLLAVLVVLIHFARQQRRPKNTMPRLADPLKALAGEPLTLGAIISVAVLSKTPPEDKLRQAIETTILAPLATSDAAQQAIITANTVYRRINDPLLLLDSAALHLRRQLSETERLRFFAALEHLTTTFPQHERSGFYLKRLKKQLALSFDQ